jgi:hypothetical protein
VIAKSTRTPGSGLYRLMQLAQNVDSIQQAHSLADHGTCSDLPPHKESDIQMSQLWYIRLGYVNFQSLALFHSKI